MTATEMVTEAPPLREPVAVPEVFATGAIVETVGGIAHIVFYQDRHEAWPKPPERIVVARIVMEAFRLDACNPKHACVRGDCQIRVQPMKLG
jgi:hypothetical protein